MVKQFLQKQILKLPIMAMENKKKDVHIFAPQLRKNIFLMIVAQMAESVDALVSNTSGVTSIPVRPRVWVLINPDNRLIIRVFSFVCSA
jgi:hypothetical protein